MLREAFLVEEIWYFMKNWALGKEITIDDFFYQLTSYDGLLLHKAEPNKFIVQIMTRRYDRYHQHGGGWLQTHCCKGATPQVKWGNVQESTWTNRPLSEKRMRHTNNSTGKAKTHQKCVTQGRDVRWKLRNTDWGNSLQQQTLLILSLWTLPISLQCRQMTGTRFPLLLPAETRAVWKLQDTAVEEPRDGGSKDSWWGTCGRKPAGSLQVRPPLISNIEKKVSRVSFPLSAQREFLERLLSEGWTIDTGV